MRPPLASKERGRPKNEPALDRARNARRERLAASNQEYFHSNEQQNQKHDRNLRQANKARVRLVVFRVVHGGMTARSIHTHVFSPCMRACSAVLVTQCLAIIKPGSNHLWHNDNVSQGAQMSLSGNRPARSPCPWKSEPRRLFGRASVALAAAFLGTPASGGQPDTGGGLRACLDSVHRNAPEISCEYRVLMTDQERTEDRRAHV